MIYAKKRLGQHFLKSRKIVEKILGAAELKPDDTILEVGPGTGALTFALARRAKRIVAVEKDRELAAQLKERLSAQGIQNVEVVKADILQFNPPHYQLKAKSYKLIGNLPYNIASAVTRTFLENAPKPSLLVVMVQKEVGERISARPPDMSLLSVAVQVYGKPEVVSRVPKEAFWPKPKVDGVVLRINPFETPLVTSDKRQVTRFFRIVKIGFSSPRKQLGGVLSRRFGREKAIRVLAAAGIPPTARPGEVSVEKWLALAKILTKLKK